MTKRICNGSVIGFVSRDWQANVINLGSFGIPGYSIHHVGIVCDGLVYESTGGEAGNRPPCEIQHKIVRGVQAHTIESLFALPWYTHLWEYPLRRRLYPQERTRLRQFCDSQLGKDYDRDGAIHSGGKLFAYFSSLIRGENVNKYFCSEFVAAALAEVGIFQIDNVSRVSPNKLLRGLRKLGVCQKPVMRK